MEVKRRRNKMDSKERQSRKISMAPQTDVEDKVIQRAVAREKHGTANKFINIFTYL
jgi:hypothetical protein